MRPVLTKLTPTRGFSSFLHYTLLVLLPLLVFVLIRLEDFDVLAFIVVILAKWRMFAVRPRFWPANVRANAVDIMVGISVVIFMQDASGALGQLLWATAYGIWLIVIKPRSTTLWISVQAGIAQFAALSALYVAWADKPLYAISLVTGGICYLAARHFIDSFDEAYARLLSYTWGYIGAALAWLLGHWLLYYQFVAQPTLLLSAVGYGLAALYYFDHYNRLNDSLRRQFVFIMLAVVLVVLTFSDWGDKVV
ncbi:hypothetical protein BH09PAT3_BH09PAT3_3110 [soil metagenome]